MKIKIPRAALNFGREGNWADAQPVKTKNKNKCALNILLRRLIYAAKLWIVS